MTCIFRVDQNKVPELWDAETGLIQREVNYSKVANGIKIDFVMDPLGSRFVVFRNSSTGKNDAGLSYNLQYGFNRKQGGATPNKAIDISYNWNVKFDAAMGGPASYQMDSLVSWSGINNDGIKYYSGTATYEKSFLVVNETVTQGTKAFAMFDNVKEMMRVSVNGNDCGIVWLPPYRVDITPYLKAGQNTITVQVINTWNNRIVGDLNSTSVKYSNTNLRSKFKANGPLLTSGLLGKAEIYFPNSKQ